MRLQGWSVRAYATAALAALVLSVPAPAKAATGDATPSVAVDLASIRIDNFGRVNTSYYRGGQPKGKDYADLASLGVKTIINLTSDDAEANEQSMTESAGMKYVQIAMTTHETPSADKVTAFLKLVNDPASQPVFVHCVGGRHRTGVMTAAYRLSQDHWTAEKAFAEMKQYKFGADFLHSEFKDFVYAYHPGPAPVDALAAVSPAPARVSESSGQPGSSSGGQVSSSVVNVLKSGN